MADSVADHLQGHAAGGVAGQYRHHDDMRFLTAEVARIPIPTVKRGEGEAVITEADVAESPSTPVAHEGAEVEAANG